MTKNAMSNDLQGVVRGFKETQQIAQRFIMPTENVIVWTFQLERHSETEERLDPIPVEMHGKNFSGFINEGNVVRLYEKSWHGGIVRTNRVYNVTFKEDIKAHGETIGSVATYIYVIIIFILLISSFIWFVSGFFR